MVSPPLPRCDRGPACCQIEFRRLPAYRGSPVPAWPAGVPVAESSCRRCPFRLDNIPSWSRSIATGSVLWVQPAGLSPGSPVILQRPLISIGRSTSINTILSPTSSTQVNVSVGIGVILADCQHRLLRHWHLSRSGDDRDCHRTLVGKSSYLTPLTLRLSTAASCFAQPPAARRATPRTMAFMLLYLSRRERSCRRHERHEVQFSPAARCTGGRRRPSGHAARCPAFCIFWIRLRDKRSSVDRRRSTRKPVVSGTTQTISSRSARACALDSYFLAHSGIVEVLHL